MMKHFLILNQDNLKQIIKHYTKAIVIFGSRYCGSCRLLVKEQLEIIAQKYPKYTFIYVDAEKDDGTYNHPTSMSLLSIKEIEYWPFWVYFKNETEQKNGYLTWGKEVDDWIEQLE